MKLIYNGHMGHTASTPFGVVAIGDAIEVPDELARSYRLTGSFQPENAPASTPKRGNAAPATAPQTTNATPVTPVE